MSDIENLPPPRGWSGDRRTAVRDLLVEEVARSKRPWWRRSRRTATVSVGALALVLAGGAASAYVAFKAPTNLASVVCYSAASPEVLKDADSENKVAAAQEEKPAGAGATATKPRPLAGKDPVAACTPLWEDGLLVAGDQKLNPNARPDGVADRRVPNLVACTLKEGVAGVFPGDADTCERLGLPSATR
jgi:hypothetical protein